MLGATLIELERIGLKPHPKEGLRVSSRWQTNSPTELLFGLMVNACEKILPAHVDQHIMI
jgi:hypothetical protein